MKWLRYITIVALCFATIPKASLHFISHLPDVISHISHHAHEHKEGGDHHKHHHNLPWQHQHTTELSQIIVFHYIPSFDIPIRFIAIDSNKVQSIYHQYLPAGYCSRIWQPPKTV